MRQGLRGEADEESSFEMGLMFLECVKRGVFERIERWIPLSICGYW